MTPAEYRQRVRARLAAEGIGIYMADDAAALSPKPSFVQAPVTYTDIHPKVAAAAIASLAVAVVLPICKQKLGLDLSGQEGNLQALIAVLAGYFMPGGD